VLASDRLVPGYVVDPDGPADSAATRFTFAKPRLPTRSSRSTRSCAGSIARARPLFVVWTQSRSGYVPYDAGFDVDATSSGSCSATADERAAGQAQLLLQFLSEPTQLVEARQMHVRDAPAAREQGPDVAACLA